MGGGGEKFVPTLIFVAVFFGITILLVGNLNGVITKQQQNLGGERIISPTQELTADMSLNLYNPSNVSVNSTSLGGNNRQETLPQFTLTGQTSIGVMVGRNWSSNYFNNFGGIYSGSSEATCIGRSTEDNPGFFPSDFVLVWQSWMGGNLYLERRYRYDIITFDDLANAHGSQAGAKNYTIVDSHLRYWVTEFFYWERIGTDPATKDQNLWSNHFKVSVTTGYNTTGSISATTLITKLLTFSLPDSWGIPVFMQVLIAIPIYTSVIIIAVLVVSYFIP